jgi:transcriptional regulator with XRE-family HTH domain
MRIKIKESREVFYREIGKKLRHARVVCGFSQKNMADALKVTFQQVQKYELGSNRIPLDRLIEWADKCNSPYEFFVKEKFVRDAKTKRDNLIKLSVIKNLNSISDKNSLKVLNNIAYLFKKSETESTK